MRRLIASSFHSSEVNISVKRWEFHKVPASLLYSAGELLKIDADSAVTATKNTTTASVFITMKWRESNYQKLIHKPG